MTKRPLIALLAASTFLAAPAFADIARLATVPEGAEITGLYAAPDGTLFMNVQHPDTGLTGPVNKGTVGYIEGADFTALPAQLPAFETAKSASGKQMVRTAVGDYRILAQQGDFAGVVRGGLGAIVAKDDTVLKVSNDPDFNGFIPTGDNAGYLFTNWEDRPGGMSRLKLEKDEDGRWVVARKDDGSADAMMLDFTKVAGTWVNCFGSVTPWNTPLSSEELYFDNTENWNDPEAGGDYSDASMTREYMGGATNPYNYGFIVEITDPAGNPTPVKHFAMGRFSHENPVVMPDQKTVYLSDDGTGTVFFKFVADKEGDLSAGTLYAAKVTQDGAKGAEALDASFDVEWVELAHASDDEIAGWIKDYDGKADKTADAKGPSYITEDEIAAWAKGEAKDDRVAFLESRKAAAAKGATAEFRKMEGVMINRDAIAAGSSDAVYMAMSEIGKTMADDQGDVQLAENPCGAVYRMTYDEGYSINRMEPILAGSGYDEANAPNACSLDGVSNPDNIAVLKDGRVIVGEDTGYHENNTLWLWTPDSQS